MKKVRSFLMGLANMYAKDYRYLKDNNNNVIPRKIKPKYKQKKK